MELTQPIPRFQTSDLQNCERINVCCLEPPLNCDSFSFCSPRRCYKCLSLSSPGGDVLWVCWCGVWGRTKEIVGLYRAFSATDWTLSARVKPETEPLHRPTVKVRKTVRGCHGTSHTFGGGRTSREMGSHSWRGPRRSSRCSGGLVLTFRWGWG